MPIDGSPAMVDGLPAFTLIVPVLNGAPELQRLLTALAEQTWQPCEIIVIDSESTDDSAAVATHAGAKVLRVERARFDHGATRNWALTFATTDLVVFTVQDAIPGDAQWLEQLLTPLVRDVTIGVTTGRQVAQPNASRLERLTRELTYGGTPLHRSNRDLDTMGLRAAFSTDANAAYRKAALVAAGGFPSPCIVSEDVAAAVRLMRAGYDMYYEPRAAIVHSHSFGWWEQLRRHFDLGVFLATSEDLIGVARPAQNAAHYASRQIRIVLSTRDPALVVHWATDLIARVSGVVLGRAYRFLPAWLRPKLSRHPAYWNAQTPQRF